jgi:Glyoxalase/Bleomycin resistance protein/Dioxygenase superfamily
LPLEVGLSVNQIPDATAACMFTPHHSGIVVSDLNAAMNAFAASLRYTFFAFEVSEGSAALSGSSPQFRLRLAIGQLDLNLIELIQPLSGTTVYSRFLAEHGPGLHHLGYSVPDLDQARKQLTARGYSCLQNGSIQDLVDFSYYDARDLGCIIEPLQLSMDLATFLLQNAHPYPE